MNGRKSRSVDAGPDKAQAFAAPSISAMNYAWPLPRPFGRFVIRLLSLWLCLAWGVATSAADAVTAASVAARLDALKETIAAEITTTLKARPLTGTYTTVWRQFEELVIAELERVLPRHVPELTATNFDRGQSGREKNRLADLALVVGGELIDISIKTARGSANPENDLGTFRDHPHRKQLFAAAFTVWVRYRDAGGKIHCDRVFLDRSWRFVGKSTLVDGVKYRKKDGNMRPKSWAMFESGESFWQSGTDFEAAVKRAEVFRANELIKEYLDDLSESDQRLLYEKLKSRFEAE